MPTHKKHYLFGSITGTASFVAGLLALTSGVSFWIVAPAWLALGWAMERWNDEIAARDAAKAGNRAS